MGPRIVKITNYEYKRQVTDSEESTFEILSAKIRFIRVIRVQLKSEWHADNADLSGFSRISFLISRLEQLLFQLLHIRRLYFAIKFSRWNKPNLSEACRIVGAESACCLLGFFFGMSGIIDVMHDGGKSNSREFKFFL